LAEAPPTVAPMPIGIAQRLRRVVGGNRLPYLIAVIAFAVYSTYAILAYLNYKFGGYDLGIFDQVVQAYARFSAPDVPLKGLGYNILGDHFHPILVLLAPLYWIWSDPRTLLLAQSALLAVSIIPVWRFTRRRLSHGQSAMVAVAYALCWPLQAMVDFDVHEVAFAVPLLAFLIDALDRKAYGWVVALSFVLLLVREDMGATVVMVALLLALRKKYLLAGVLAAMGIGGYLFATAVVIPAFAQNGQFAYWSYDALGPNLPTAVVHIVTNPIATIRTFFWPITKTFTLLATFGLTTIMTSLFSPYLLLTIPLLAQRMFSSREVLWGLAFHYSGPLAPILFMAGVDGIMRLRRRFGFEPVWLTRWTLALVAIPLVGGFIGGSYPLEMLVSGQAWRSDAHAESLNRILPLIPSNVCVEADDRAVPHLLHRTYVTNPGIPDPPPTWVLLDLSQKETGYLGPKPADYLKKVQAEGFTTFAEDGSIILLHRPGPVDPSCLQD
jgi:uncharacterized membrane protein